MQFTIIAAIFAAVAIATPVAQPDDAYPDSMMVARGPEARSAVAPLRKRAKLEETGPITICTTLCDHGSLEPCSKDSDCGKGNQCVMYCD